MTYVCKSCGEYAEDIDEPACGEKCKRFSPMKIATIHLACRQDSGRFRVVCLNQDAYANTSIRLTTILSATTCQRCIDAVKKLREETRNKVIKTSPFQEVSEAPTMNWASLNWSSLGLPDEAVSDITNHPAADTPNTFREWILAGNDPSQVSEYSEIILASLYLEKV